MRQFEYRWAALILEAYVPPSNSGLAPREGEVDWIGKLQRSIRISGRLAGLGVRVAVWMLMFAPFWSMGRLRTMRGLTTEQRCDLLTKLIHHRWFVVRELTLLLKINVCMAMLGTPSVVARSGYYEGSALRDRDSKDSGERHRLPVLETPDRAVG